ncbi:MAG TPA: HAMP domain-containing sensor histidine kinase [Pyrinomonadaceae bacterium]|nr:HAMP domain-containing sensor histidine kinase [Pyrinomonadaceae bacterium]
MKKRKLLGGFNRFRLILTLGLAVVLPAAALIVLNFYQLRSFQRDKLLEAMIYRDFQEVLAGSEKRMNRKIYAKVEEVRQAFPAPDVDSGEKEDKLNEILSQNPIFTHAFLFDEKGEVFQTESSQENDKYVREEHDRLLDSYRTWFSSKEETKGMVEMMQKKAQHIAFNASQTKRADGAGYLLTAFFVLPNVPGDRMVIGGVTFDPCYIKNTFFPTMLNEALKDKSTDQSGNGVAMIVYHSDPSDMHEIMPLAATAGWEAKPEVSRKLDDVFGGLWLGIRFQGTSGKELGQAWMRRNFIILGILSALIIIGLMLTKHVVSKEVALAKLKSDFVSNVSHELRTPLALIRLYAETLELGRITTKEKKHDYYKIIRKESERLTSLINNILDFSRIEAGHKEYEFRETDIADLVRNTLDSYRYQIEQQGFTLKEEIDESLPIVCVDREAIARALLNLMNNALKYSADDKFLRVKLYRENGTVKLVIEDHGIGITSREQSKIFEKFYRTGDPLVHNTKGSGLGLSLVRHITDAHGGSIDVDSTPGKGSKFILSLPLNGKMRRAAAHN